MNKPNDTSTLRIFKRRPEKVIYLAECAALLIYFSAPTYALENIAKQPAEQESRQVVTKQLLAESNYDEESPKTGLFESRFILNEKNEIDVSVFDNCPSQSEQSSVRSPFSPERQTNDGQHNSYYWQKNSAEKSVSQLNSPAAIIRADEVPEDSEKRLLVKGNVSMLTDSTMLMADKLVTDKINHQLTAIGNVSVENNESLLLANKFEADQNSSNSKLTDVQFRFFKTNANGEAESIAFTESSVVTFNDLTFSTCPTNAESWRFSASELKLDQDNGRGEAWGMWLKVKGIPVFYFPYFNFSLDSTKRKTGLLAPEIKSSSRNGLDVLQPFYWNIAENYDMTLLPRYIQKRGAQLGGEFRYLSESSVNQFSFEVLQGDKLVKNLLIQEPGLSEGLYGLSEDRWALAFKNESHFGEYWSASIDASLVSDRDYFRDLGTNLISPQGTNSQSQVLSRGDINYQDDIWQVSLLAESTQSLVGDEPYRIVPSLIASADYYQTSLGLRWQLESDFSRFDHSDPLQITGSRLGIMPSVSFPIQSSYAWLIPKASYQMTSYQQKNMNTPSTTIDRSLPIVSVDSGMYFDRDVKWNDKSVVHTLEPRLFYAYIPYRDQQAINIFDSRSPDFSFTQLYRANRFVGEDRIGDTNHIALSLTNRFEDSQTGEQLFSFSFGRKFFLEDRRVNLGSNDVVNSDKSSAWLAEASYSPTAKIEFSGFIEWNDGDSEQNFDRGTKLARSRIKYEPIANHIVNLSHRVRNKDGFSNEEMDLSFAWPINDEWRLVGRWYNDLLKDRTAETMFGFEYESCCWAVSVVSRRYLDVQLDAAGVPITTGQDEFNSGVQMQFVFKGLGGAGQNGVSRLLESSIRGYRARF